jgi:hypothetical protein
MAIHWMEDRKPRRFWSKVAIADDNECWEWQGSPDKRGMGQFRVRDRMWPAHHVAWILTNGPIPDKLENPCILQICGNKLCCNPDHLFPGTRSEAAWLRKQPWKGSTVPSVRAVQEIHSALMHGRSPRYVQEKYNMSSKIFDAITEGHLWDWVTGRGSWKWLKERGPAWAWALAPEYKIKASYNFIGSAGTLPGGVMLLPPGSLTGKPPRCPSYSLKLLPATVP